MRGDPYAAIGHLQEALRLRRGGPQPAALMPALELLAWSTEAAGQHERAAVLHGAVHQIKETFGLSLTPWAKAATFIDPTRESVARTRQALGGTAFEAAFRRGTELSGDDLLRYALGEKPTHARRPPAPAPSPEEAGPPAGWAQATASGSVAEGGSARARRRRSPGCPGPPRRSSSASSPTTARSPSPTIAGPVRSRTAAGS
jgi:non-specific serine/threonine protein kinase